MSEQKMIDVIKLCSTNPLGITSSPSTTLDITIDIREDTKHERVLGQMVYVIVEEDGRNVLVIGQIISIETKNRWHEDPSFKGVIKRHGRLPHLSGTADNRIATISVQACYAIGDIAESHILGTSPSTGERVDKMNNEVMKTIMKHYEPYITYMGKVYGTNVDLPFWFKHFGQTQKGEQELGANDAYHIGVFGKTGSGKTVTACYMLLGYVKNKKNMNILVLDPQGQFYNDTELLPCNVKFEDKVKSIGMKYYKYRILEDIFLPANAFLLFAILLQKSGFIKKSFNILSDREEFAADAIALYLENFHNNSKGKSANLNKLNDDAENFDLMKKTLEKFTEAEDVPEDEESTPKKKKGKSSYNKYIDMVYSQNARKDQLIGKIKSVLSNDALLKEIFNSCWKPVTVLFCDKKADNSQKKAMKEIIDIVTNVSQKGNFVVLDLSEKRGGAVKENLQAMFVKMIESEIKVVGETFYEQNKKVNCLVVMDEAHRFISRDSVDSQIADLTSEIIDSVRTTRKYGIGYMFITQTIESLDKEIIQQMRIFGFGYGLTTGLELRRISELINNESAIKLYRSFIDPSSNNKFPFMFFGPISPLSFTGSPLFLEVYSDVSKFK